jgi:hypothetical protein
MRVWLIGAGNIGSVALRQLQKNPSMEIFVSDPSDRPEAVRSGLIERVDLVENVTPFNVNEVARRVRPDLILLSPGIGEQGFGAIEGSKALSEALNYEMIIASQYPCLILSLSNQS